MPAASLVQRRKPSGKHRTTAKHDRDAEGSHGCHHETLEVRMLKLVNKGRKDNNGAARQSG